jgi:hypothetical protein
MYTIGVINIFVQGFSKETNSPPHVVAPSCEFINICRIVGHISALPTSGNVLTLILKEFHLKFTT